MAWGGSPWDLPNFGVGGFGGGGSNTGEAGYNSFLGGDTLLSDLIQSGRDNWRNQGFNKRSGFVNHRGATSRRDIPNWWATTPGGGGYGQAQAAAGQFAGGGW